MDALIVKLDPTVAETIRAGEHNEIADSVLAVVASHGLALVPLHPRRTSGMLASFFTVDAHGANAESLARKLRGSPGVRGAYVEPQAEPAGVPGK